MKTEIKTDTAVVKKEEKFMEYVPYGAKDIIRINVAIIRRMIAVPTTTGKVPTDDDCMKFMMMCQARRLNPFEGDAFMVGYDTKTGPKFSLITAHQAFLKRAELNPEYDGMKSGVIIIRDKTEVHELEGDFFMDGDVLLGGWATVFCKKRVVPMTKRVKLSTFNKGTQQWASNPAGMIVKCAEADALRSTFPTMLGGLYMKDEINEPFEPPKVSTPIFREPIASKEKVVEIAAKAEVDENSEYDAHQELMETMLGLAAKDGIETPVLSEFMESVGFLATGVKEVESASDDDIKQMITRWVEFLPRMKGSDV